MKYNANGAGIAADPTLTSAWTPLAHDASGEPSASFAPGYAWRPMSSLSLPCLAAGLARDLSPALAPASGFRSCPAAPFRSPKPPMFAALRSRLAETALLYRSGLAAVPDLRPSPSPVPARSPACPVTSRRSRLKRADLHSAEASCMPSLDRRVDRHHRHPWDQNSGNFKALRLSVPVASCPEDKLKVRLNRRSGNIPAADFSTSNALGCGHEWITQRFVAFVAKRVSGRERNRRQTVTLKARRRRSERGDSVFPIRFSAIRRPGCGARAAADAAR
ncbi:MAG: hypothetical protein RLZZ475_2530 [Pseudomonadota bacterium]|jgi:hypothetical protein